MAYSVSVHNGSKVNIGHNNRTRDSIYTQSHIDKNGEFIILQSEDLRDVYTSLFGKAVQDYNDNQKRNNRKINNYYDKIEQGKAKKNNPKPCYEVIIQIGNRDECMEDEQLNIEILKEYIKGWNARLPQLKLFNAVIHNDEPNGTIHAHLSYCPFAYYDKGLTIRNSLNKALNQMGFENDTFSNTPIMRWQKSEQQVLMDICSQYDVETEIKKTAKRKHLEKEEYIQLKRKENIEKDIHNLKVYNFELEEQSKKQKEIINKNADMIYQQEEVKEQQKKEIIEQEKEVFKIQDALDSIDEEIKKYKIENAQYKTNFINYFNNLINNFVGFCDYQEREKIVDTLTNYIENVSSNIKDIDNKENSMSEIISFVKNNINAKSKNKQNDYKLEI